MLIGARFGTLIVLLIGLALLSLAIGPYPLSLSAIIQTFLQGPHGAASFAHTVLWEIRLPHVLGALLIGAALAISGAAYQGMFINPLVSPEVLGVLAGAGFGAALGLVWSESFWIVQLSSLGFGLLAVALAVGLAWRIGGEHALIVLVLSGMITGALFSALLSIVKYTADPYDKLPAIVYWLMGSLSQITWHNLAWAAPLLLLSMGLLLRESARLNVLTQGDEEAQSLGVPVQRTRLTIILLTTLLASVTVMLAGMIAWVGLIVPHLARLIVGADHRLVLPFSALLGAGYLLLVDLLARSFTTVEIPIGILTALIGLPVFALLLARLGASGWR
ncbi:FecCD family ABC transporter permease [Halothiobacillus sp. DCM-1]|uniref:FecCD family ABC transporter permease n=1 Tax=Halothiobacillus sp. DCM-1 TaxID=3112558 RepID=UPI00324F74E0